MIPSMTLANDKDPAEEIRQGALSVAKGDTAKAFIVLSERTATVLDGTNKLQAENEACARANERLSNYADDRSWLREAYDSDVVKVGIFIGGIWLGTRIVDNVND